MQHSPRGVNDRLIRTRPERVRNVARMTILQCTPAASDLTCVVSELARWQSDEWPGFLHPGDLGWHSLVGAERTAADLRVWAHDGKAVAIGMLDEPDLLRMAVDPSASDDESVAAHIRRDLVDPAQGVLAAGEAVIEARGAHALQDTLRAEGWVDDEPWTPLQLRLDEPLDIGRLERAAVRIASVGPDQAAAWIAVHWSAFRATPLDDETRARFAKRWTTMATGPLAHLAQHLIAFDSDDAPVAVTSVWAAEPGRPGLIEPMGVHNDQHGKGYGVAITLAGARALQLAGSSSAVVVAEGSNPGALATYVASGFVPSAPVTDLRRA